MPHLHIRRGQRRLQVLLHLLEHGRHLFHVLDICRQSLLEWRVVAINVDADTDRARVAQRVCCQESRITNEEKITTQRRRQVVALERFDAFQVGVGICLGDH